MPITETHLHGLQIPALPEQQDLQLLHLLLLPLLFLQVFVTATARCLDLATALVLESGVMLLVSPSMRQQLLQRLNDVIFPADDVSVTDVSDKCRMLTVLGPQADDVMKQLAGVSGAPQD